MVHTKIAELDLLSSVLKDAIIEDQDLRIHLDLFYKEVEKRAITRGWKQILLIDLPDLGKVFDKGLSSQYLDFKTVPQAFGKLDTEERVRSSWIYNALLCLVFDMSGIIFQEVKPSHVATIRQVLLMFKKVKLDCPKERIKASVQEFLEIEKDLRLPCGSWDRDTWLPFRHTFSDGSFSGKQSFPGWSKVWPLLDAVCARVMPQSEPRTFEIIPRHGPGACSDIRTGSDKYLFASWPAKLAGTFDFAHFCTPNLGMSVMKPVSQKEPPAKLLAVPKTFKGPRLITSEPAPHMFLQQGMLRWLRESLTTPLRTCISFHDQGPSQAFAKEGSISGDIATVDLSSASDRLSCWTVERAFGFNQSLLSHLHAVRTRVVIDGTGTFPFSVKLKKFAGQGCAVTFPIQTMVYAACCLTAELHSRNLKATNRNIKKVAKYVRVYGDDIAISSSAVDTLSNILHALQLKVNASKTHHTGFFRESCGKDMYEGTDVTPVYVSSLCLEPKPKPAAIASWVEVSNNLHRMGWWRSADYMLKQLNDNLIEKLPISNSPGDGIRLFSYSRGTVVRRSRPRWNESLCRHEAKALVLRATTRKKSRGSAFDLLDYFLQDPSPDVKWEHGYKVGDSLKLRREWVSLD
jgi:hypothetical protein